MNVVLMMQEILLIANAVIGESALPDFAFASENVAQRVRVAAFDELDGVFDRDAVGGSQQKMYVFGHDDERVQLISTFAAVSVNSL